MTGLVPVVLARESPFQSRQCVRAAKEMDSKSIGLCPQGFESPRCRIAMQLRRHAPFCVRVRPAKFSKEKLRDTLAFGDGTAQRKILERHFYIVNLNTIAVLGGDPESHSDYGKHVASETYKDFASLPRAPRPCLAPETSLRTDLHLSLIHI